MLMKKKREIMRKHISKLKNPYKAVIEMREIKKMSYRDISDQTRLKFITDKVTNKEWSGNPCKRDI